MKPNKFKKPVDYLVIYYIDNREYPIIERLTKEEILELRQNHDFRDIAVIEGEVVKSFGTDDWCGIL